MKKKTIVEEVRDDRSFVGNARLPKGVMPNDVLESRGRDLDKAGTPFENIDMQKIMDSAQAEIDDAFQVDQSVINEFKKYKFTDKEVEFIKNAKIRTPFHIRRIKNKTFIITGDKKLMDANVYLSRVEAGLTKFHKKYIKESEVANAYIKTNNNLETQISRLNGRIDGLLSYDYAQTIFINRCTSLGFWGMIKLTFINLYLKLRRV